MTLSTTAKAIALACLAISPIHTAMAEQSDGPGMFRGLPLPNPYLSWLPNGAEPNYEYWQKQGSQLTKPQLRSLGRDASAQALPQNRSYQDVFDNESLSQMGLNDSEASAIVVSARHSRLQGRLYNPETTIERTVLNLTEQENNDTASSATSVQMGQSSLDYVVSGMLGDGLGQTRDSDVYHIEGFNRQDALYIEVTQADTSLDRLYVTFFDQDKSILGRDRVDNGYLFTGGLLPDYIESLYMSVGTWYLYEDDIDDADRYTFAGSDNNRYQLRFFQSEIDQDVYRIHAETGQTISLSFSNPYIQVAIHKDGKNIHSGSMAAMEVYPEFGELERSTLGSLAYPVLESGDYHVVVSSAVAVEKNLDYEIKASVVDNAGAYLDKGEHQIVFLDFNGATFNGRPFNSVDEVVTLSPLADFMQAFGLTLADEAELIHEVTARVKTKVENVLPEFQYDGDAKFTLLNSVEHNDVFGQKNVSRIIVGGTIEELGASALGIAQSVDVGNYEPEETAIVMLDLLSDPDYEDSAHKVATNGTRLDLVAEMIAVVAAHELGHILSAHHTDNDNDVPNIMDSGGDIRNQLGAGDDGIFRTADDLNVSFVTDELTPNAGLTGDQATGQIIAQALKSGEGSSNSSKSSDDDGPLGLGSLNVGYWLLFLVLSLATYQRRKF